MNEVRNEGRFDPHVPSKTIDATHNNGFANALSARDIEDLLRALYAGFFAVDPYGLKYDGVMCAIEYALSYLKMGRECNVP
jgi:hypothetical protein